MNKLFLIEVMKNNKIKKEVNEENNIDLTKTKAVGAVVNISDYFFNKKCN